MITAILGWTKLPQWALELIVIALVAGGIWYWQHSLVEKGIAEQVALDTIASDKLKAETTRLTAELQIKATTAEQAYDKERADNQSYRDSHPIQPIRLCISTAIGRALVSAASAPHPGNESTSTAAQNIHDLPSGNSSSGAGAAGPDIGPLLDLLANKADQISSELREFQSR
jgi:hypothetical protein